MNKHSAAYRRRLKRKLRCGRSVKTRLLEKFDTMLTAFLEENPDPTADQLEDGFGPPGYVAELLMHKVTPEEHVRYRRNRLTVILAACILAAAFICTTIYTYVFLEIPVNYFDNSYTRSYHSQTATD